MTAIELQLKTTLLQMTAWEAHRMALDAAAYQKSAQDVAELMRDHFSSIVHLAHGAASEGFQTACQNAYFEKHGKFSDKQATHARQIQQFANHVLTRARIKARTGHPLDNTQRGDASPA